MGREGEPGRDQYQRGHHVCIPTEVVDEKATWINTSTVAPPSSRRWRNFTASMPRRMRHFLPFESLEKMLLSCSSLLDYPNHSRPVGSRRARPGPFPHGKTRVNNIEACLGDMFDLTEMDLQTEFWNQLIVVE